MELKRSSRLRRWFEQWLSRKFMVRYGPAMLQRRGYWTFVDAYGSWYRIQPTYDHDGTPLRIIKESVE